MQNIYRSEIYKFTGIYFFIRSVLHIYKTIKKILFRILLLVILIKLKQKTETKFKCGAFRRFIECTRFFLFFISRTMSADDAWNVLQFRGNALSIHVEMKKSIAADILLRDEHNLCVHSCSGYSVQFTDTDQRACTQCKRKREKNKRMRGGTRRPGR